MKFQVFFPVPNGIQPLSPECLRRDPMPKRVDVDMVVDSRRPQVSQTWKHGFFFKKPFFFTSVQHDSNIWKTIWTQFFQETGLPKFTGWKKTMGIRIRSLFWRFFRYLAAILASSTHVVISSQAWTQNHQLDWSDRQSGLLSYAAPFRPKFHQRNQRRKLFHLEFFSAEKWWSVPKCKDVSGPTKIPKSTCMIHLWAMIWLYKYIYIIYIYIIYIYIYIIYILYIYILYTYMYISCCWFELRRILKSAGLLLQKPMEHFRLEPRNLEDPETLCSISITWALTCWAPG